MSQGLERLLAAKAAAAQVPTCPHDTADWQDGQITCMACGEILDEPGTEHCPPEASAHSVLSEKPHLRLLTKPTKAPSVSVVSAPGRHVVKNAQEEDPPVQYWSDVVQERFWVVPTAAQAAALMAQGQVAYQPDEIWQLRDLKASDPQAFPEKLKAIHQAKSIFDATVTHEDPPPAGRTARRSPRERSAKPRDPRLGPILPPCATCGELRYWHEHETDRWRCWTCTPPPPRRQPVVMTPATAVDEDAAQWPEDVAEILHKGDM
jgi:hypothetical protein